MYFRHHVGATLLYAIFNCIFKTHFLTLNRIVSQRILNKVSERCRLLTWMFYPSLPNPLACFSYCTGEGFWYRDKFSINRSLFFLCSYILGREKHSVFNIYIKFFVDLFQVEEIPILCILRILSMSGCQIFVKKFLVIF